MGHVSEVSESPSFWGLSRVSSRLLDASTPLKAVFPLRFSPKTSRDSKTGPPTLAANYRPRAEVTAGSPSQAGPACLLRPGPSGPSGVAESLPCSQHFEKSPPLTFTFIFDTGDALIPAWHRSKLRLREEAP